MIALLALAAASNAASPQTAPATAESELDGARYALRRDDPSGNWQQLYYHIQGHVIHYMREEYVAQTKTLRPVQFIVYPLVGDTFLIRFEAAQCLRMSVTDDCAIRGTAKEDGIHFNYLVNGQVADDRDPTGLPKFIPRQN